jgi:hypothetical protein
MRRSWEDLGKFPCDGSFGKSAIAVEAHWYDGRVDIILEEDEFGELKSRSESFDPVIARAFGQALIDAAEIAEYAGPA